MRTRLTWLGQHFLNLCVVSIVLIVTVAEAADITTSSLASGSTSPSITLVSIDKPRVPVYNPPLRGAEPSQDIQRTTTLVPIYRPPLRGAAPTRVGAVSRGGDDTRPVLSVLAPNHVGLTTKEQPSIFWYQSKPVSTRFELTIVKDRKLNLVLTLDQVNSSGAGIHRLRLSDHKLSLETGVEYRWTVALVVDEQHRSKDIVASGVIKRVQPFAKLKERLATAAPTDLPFIYADEGIWYDAIESLSDLINAHPDNVQFRAQRSALLEQVRLPEAAAYDQEQGEMLARSSPTDTDVIATGQ